MSSKEESSILHFAAGHDTADLISKVVRARQTFKVLGDPDEPVTFDAKHKSACDAIVESAIKTSAWAPFHYDRGHDALAEPWRVDWLQTPVCRTIALQLSEWFDDVKPTNKLPAMLAGCGSLVLVSWLPQFADSNTESTDANLKRSQQQTDEEHLAATSAYVQNLLLILTAAGLGTYWSSGGQFRRPEMFERLGMSHGGRLMAAVFVDYSNSTSDGMERLAGKHRDRRCQQGRWLRRVSSLEE
ncbi:MAG: nitroreductase family protein [Planctomycetota bacterium]